ncbi:MAG: DMT family transporter [Gemmatimonadaceae bacterium]
MSHRLQWTLLVLLGAIWGSSFMFMRVAVPAFGPVPLIAIRVTIAALTLAPILAWQRKLVWPRASLGHLVLVGVLNSALPFCLFAYATQTISAGLAAVLNSTVPIFAVLIARAWLHQPITLTRGLGTAVGFAGVTLLVWHDLATRGQAMAIIAGTTSSVCYAFAAHYTRRYLAHLDPLVVATGSQIAAAMALLPIALFTLPHRWPSSADWGAVFVLGLLCTSAAYAIYFQLIARIGASSAVLVTYLIPVFGIVWEHSCSASMCLPLSSPPAR